MQSAPPTGGKAGSWEQNFSYKNHRLQTERQDGPNRFPSDDLFGTLRESAFTQGTHTSMIARNVFPLDGGCDCGAVRYRMLMQPLLVHCCHCRWCQRESGASFALNAMIEADYAFITA